MKFLGNLLKSFQKKQKQQEKKLKSSSFAVGDIVQIVEKGNPLDALMGYVGGVRKELLMVSMVSPLNQSGFNNVLASIAFPKSACVVVGHTDYFPFVIEELEQGCETVADLQAHLKEKHRLRAVQMMQQSGISLKGNELPN